MRDADSCFPDQARAHGLRVTPQREAVYAELVHSGQHPTAEQLFKAVRQRFPNISLDTVNRTLLTFAKIGLASVVESYGSPRRYDADLEPHHHAHCIKCGMIMDFQDKSFENLQVPDRIRQKFKVVGKKVVLKGICNRCRGR